MVKEQLEQLYIRPSSINPKEVFVRWTMFGEEMGQSFDPSLSIDLEPLITSVTYGVHTATLSIIVTEKREDLRLIRHLQRNGKKEFQVHTINNQGYQSEWYAVFHASSLLDFTVSQSTEASVNEPMITTVTVGGSTEVRKKS